MKVLVTGATGFVGRHILRAILKAGVEVIATATGRNGSGQDLSNEGITFVPYDTNESRRDVFELLGRPDTVIHLSWEGLPHYNELYHFERNLPVNYGFLKDMIEGGTRSVTVIGTCLEYGKQNGPLSEETTPQPSTPYGLAKDTLRRFLEELRKKNEFKLKWIRLFYLYGEGQSKGSLLEQLRAAIARGDKEFKMSKGDQLRDYMPVERAAEYIVRIALRSHTDGIINCCSGVPISVRSLVEVFVKSASSSIALDLGFYPYPEYEPMAFWGDTGKLQLVLQEAGD